MTPRLSGRFSIFGLVFFVFKSLLEIARKWTRKKIAILSLKPRSHVRIFIFRTWAIRNRVKTARNNIFLGLDMQNNIN